MLALILSLAPALVGLVDDTPEALLEELTYLEQSGDVSVEVEVRKAEILSTLPITIYAKSLYTIHAWGGCILAEAESIPPNISYICDDNEFLGCAVTFKANDTGELFMEYYPECDGSLFMYETAFSWYVY